MALQDPARDMVPIVKGDTEDDNFPTSSGIYIGVGGTLHVVNENGAERTIPGVLSGMVYPFRLKRVFTDSTATDLFALYN